VGKQPPPGGHKETGILFPREKGPKIKPPGGKTRGNLWGLEKPPPSPRKPRGKFRTGAFFGNPKGKPIWDVVGKERPKLSKPRWDCEGKEMEIFPRKKLARARI